MVGGGQGGEDGRRVGGRHLMGRDLGSGRHWETTDQKKGTLEEEEKGK